ncbi:uncharacterized protein TM35_000451130 [Trypanosoma theileri]|uniref:Titin n=1 Tax=Trypanosoma theileri TaxID=67003 RepID=A0A1X0NI16_9TRYP|nr:uncharacterized protein TM35_000451130 [Trypanosoma theileri]ORC84375.1 hypothetical protein TM35_000451130 [Trypanosoma theileri]
MVMMRYVLCILALLLSCACVHVLAEEVPAADLSDQVPDTESETKIVLPDTSGKNCTNGGPPDSSGKCNSLLEKPGLGADGSPCRRTTDSSADCTSHGVKAKLEPVASECNSVSSGNPGTCTPLTVQQPPATSPALQPVLPPPPQVKQEEVHQKEDKEHSKEAPHNDEHSGVQTADNRVSTESESDPAGSEGRENTSSTAGNADSQNPQQNTTEGQATTSSTEDTPSSGDGDSNNTNPQTQSESANEGGDSNPSNQTTTAADETGTEGSLENVNAESSTTTTTTTTTLPPELTNNKKGDADSSSSISSSVWVRVPLLIVVTLACILVC